MYDSGVVRKVCAFLALPETDKKPDISSTVKVPGEIKRSRDLRGGRWSWTLKLAQKRS